MIIWISLSQAGVREGLNFILFHSFTHSFHFLYIFLCLLYIFSPPSIPFLPCPLSPLPNPRKNQRIIYGNIKEVICMMNGMAFMFLSLSFPSLPYNSLPVSLPLALCFFLSPHSWPSRYVGALTCFRLKLTHLLCPWPNQAIHYVCFSGAGANSRMYSTPAGPFIAICNSLNKNHPGRMTSGTLETFPLHMLLFWQVKINWPVYSILIVGILQRWQDFKREHLNNFFLAGGRFAYSFTLSIAGKSLFFFF